MKVTVKVEMGGETFESSYSHLMVMENFDIARRAFPDDMNPARIWVNLAIVGIGETGRPMALRWPGISRRSLRR